MTPFLTLKQCNIGYKKTLVEDITAEAYLGNVILLMGNNGVGKTTLIKTLLNQTQVLEGVIQLNDKVLKLYNPKELAEQIAIVFSKAEIPHNYTVFDLISFGKYIHYPYYFKLNQSDLDDVNRIIARLQLQQYRDVQLSHLSDGNLQKAFIGRALAQNSPFIILDEPTTHLDEANKLMILKLLRDLAQLDHKLILFSSHDWRLAKEFSDQIWWIKDQTMVSGLTENVLLAHQDLLQSHLLAFHPGFVAPTIIAPQLQKELLYSFLQKNFEIDLSSLKISYVDQFWMVQLGDSQSKLDNFTSLKDWIKTSINTEF